MKYELLHVFLKITSLMWSHFLLSFFLPGTCICCFLKMIFFPLNTGSSTQRLILSLFFARMMGIKKKTRNRLRLIYTFFILYVSRTWAHDLVLNSWVKFLNQVFCSLFSLTVNIYEWTKLVIIKPQSSNSDE